MWQFRIMPELPSVHRRVRPTRVRKVTGVIKISVVIASRIRGPKDGFHLDAGTRFRFLFGDFFCAHVARLYR